MGLIGKVIKSFFETLSGSGTEAQFSSVEELSGDQRTSQIFGPCNEDFAPPEDCKTYDIRLGEDKGYLISIAYHNQLIQPVAEHGERRLYSTNKEGDEVMTEVFLKQDGTVLITNKDQPGYIRLFPSGVIMVNDATITIGGDFITKNGISLDNHTHSQGIDSRGDTQANTNSPVVP